MTRAQSNWRPRRSYLIQWISSRVAKISETPPSQGRCSNVRKCLGEDQGKSTYVHCSPIKIPYSAQNCLHRIPRHATLFSSLVCPTNGIMYDFWCNFKVDCLIKETTPIRCDTVLSFHSIAVLCVLKWRNVSINEHRYVNPYDATLLHRPVSDGYIAYTANVKGLHHSVYTRNQYWRAIPVPCICVFRVINRVTATHEIVTIKTPPPGRELWKIIPGSSSYNWI